MNANESPLPAQGYVKVLWWIITVLTGISCGAGSTWLTRLDGMAQLKAEVKVLSDKVDKFADRLEKHR